LHDRTLRTPRISDGTANALGGDMSVDYLLGAILSVLLTGYLVYALVRPEQF
jgi:K+-transporting ATPase KdpF subunit